MKNYKAEYPIMWDVLTSRFNFINLIGFSKKRKEDYLQSLLEIAYYQGRVDAITDTLQELKG